MSAPHTYIVQTREFGEIRKAADTIAEARTWARLAFPGEHCPVRRETTPRRCGWCGSTPSLCDCTRRKS